MKANQIRIGNYVRDPYNKEIKVAHVSPDDASFLNPIPLTEDWVLKLGFEKSNFYHNWCIDVKDIRHSVQLKGDKWCYSEDASDANCYMSSATIDYVHQLQNLHFAITGEELKIKDNG